MILSYRVYLPYEEVKELFDGCLSTGEGDYLRLRQKEKSFRREEAEWEIELDGLLDFDFEWEFGCGCRQYFRGYISSYVLRIFLAF